MKKRLLLALFIIVIAPALEAQICFPKTSYLSGSTIMSVDTADFNGDTFLDIVVSCHGPSNSVNIFFGDDLGNFTAGPVITGFGMPPRYVASGDIDGDLDMDVMVTHNNGNGYSTVINNGAGSFAAPTIVFGVAGSHIIINCGDLDNDGDTDFAYAMNSAVVILQNNGAGTFSETTLGKSYDGYGLAKGDMNNDGKTDIISIAHSDSVGILLNTNTTPGLLSFGSNTSYYKGQSNFFDLRFVTCRDLNNDGFKDIISSHRNSNSVGVFMGDGTGTLGTPMLYNIGGQAYNTDVADFNQDGNLDFVVAASFLGAYKVYYGDGTGVFPASAAFATSADFAGLISADFNSDSRPDIATAGSVSSDSLTVNLNIASPSAPIVTTPVIYCGGDVASPLSATGINLMWYTVGAGGTGSSSTPTPSTTVPGTTNHFVSQNPSGACESPRDTIQVIVHPGMTSSGGNSNACMNTQFLLPFFMSGGTAPINYLWTPAVGSPFNTSSPDTLMFISAANSYTVTATDANGCITTNTTDITVTASTDVYGVISSSTLGLINPGNVYAFQYLPNNSGFDTVGVVSTNALGEYTFTSLDAGFYLIKALADSLIYSTAVPTYFGNEFQWDSSAVVNHFCVQTDTANIQVIELTGGSGTGYISGYVIEANGFGSRLMNPGHDNIFAPGGPLKGIDVKLGRNPGGGIQARTMTDPTGKYEFNNIPLQGYDIYVDIPNLPMDSLRHVNLSVGNETSIENNYFADSIQIYINSNIVSISDLHTNKTLLIQTFPNPVSNKINISVQTSERGWFYSELIDLTGKKVLVTSQQKMEAGKNTFSIHLNQEGIVKGIYTMNNYINNNRYTTKVVIIE